MSTVDYQVWTLAFFAEQRLRYLRSWLRYKTKRLRASARSMNTKQNRQALAWYVTLGPAVALWLSLVVMYVTV